LDDGGTRVAALFGPETGLDAPIGGGGKLRDIAGRIVEIASAGLTARNRLNSGGDNESGFLDPLREVVASGKTPAEVLLDKYHGEWGGDIPRLW
jgi:glutamate--cysteine ligase